MSLLCGHIDRGAHFEGQAHCFAKHFSCPFEDEDLVFPPVRVERCVAAWLESKKPHGEVLRTVLLRDQRSEFHALQIMLSRKVGGLRRVLL